MAKHPQAPWKIQPYSGDEFTAQEFWIIDASGRTVCLVDDEDTARLIASSPDLCEALAGWIVVAAMNGAMVSEDLLDWAGKHLNGKPRTPAEVTYVAIAMMEGHVS